MGRFGLLRALFTVGSIAQLVSAHFELLNPPTIGVNDDTQDLSPCGGDFPDFTAVNLSNFHTNSEPIAVYLANSQATWLFRAMVISDEAVNNTDPESPVWDAENWEQLYPVVKQTGAQNFCIPNVTVPYSWSGQKGILSVVSHGPDGLMYLCLAVNFVSGVSPGSPNCKNGTYSHVADGQSTVTGEFASDTALETLVRAALPEPSNPPASTTTADPTPSTTRDLSGDRWGDTTTSHGMSHSAQVAVAVCMSFAAIFFLGVIILLWRRRLREKTVVPTYRASRRGAGGNDGLTRPLAMRQLSRRSNAPEDGLADPPPPYEYSGTPPSTANPGANAAHEPAPPMYTRDSQILQRPLSTASPI